MNINYLIVVAAAFVATGIGLLWYSQFTFGRHWAQLIGFTGNKPHIPKRTFYPELLIGIEFLLLLIMSYILAIFSLLLHISTIGEAAALGFWLWLGFQAPVLLSATLFERKSVRLFFINASHRLVTLLVMSLIVSLWH